jgi:hypothetical protein
MKNKLFTYFLITCIFLTGLNINAQDEAAQIKELIANVEKLTGDIRRLKEEYDAKISSDQNEIKNLKDVIETFKTNVTSSVAVQQKSFEDKYSLAQVPVGTVLSYYSDLSKLPENWKFCNGDTVTDAQSVFFNKKLPNLQGKFLRGTGITINLLGTTGGQDLVEGHQHWFSGRDDNVWFPIESISGYIPTYPAIKSINGEWDESLRNLSVRQGDNLSGHGHKNGHASISGNTLNAGSHDNRPAFVSVYYIIRIK